MFCLPEFILTSFPWDLLAARTKLTCIIKFDEKEKKSMLIKKKDKIITNEIVLDGSKNGEQYTLGMLPLISQNNFAIKTANNQLHAYPADINLNVNSILLNVVSNGSFTTLYLTYDSKMWRKEVIQTKWMLIPEDMKHNILDFHWSIMNTKSFLKYKSFPHKIIKGIEPVISTIPI